MKEVRAANGVVYLKAENIRSPHGFSTRTGGVSRLPHTASLNLTYGMGDSEETVRENLRRFACAVGFDAHALVSGKQIHSATVRYVSEADRGAGYDRPSTFSCDGIVSDRRGVALGVRTADCVPILLEAIDGCGEVIAVSAVHAGWRGTVAGIAAEAVEGLCRLGAVRECIQAAIGPCICPDCFCVREDFCEAVRQARGDAFLEKHVKRDGDGIYHASLVAMNCDILAQCGIQNDHIACANACTCHEPHRFYSHRYSHGVRGGMLSVIMRA